MNWNIYNLVFKWIEFMYKNWFMLVLFKHIAGPGQKLILIFEGYFSHPIDYIYNMKQAFTLQSMAIFRGSFFYIFEGSFLHFGGKIAWSPRVMFFPELVYDLSFISLKHFSLTPILYPFCSHSCFFFYLITKDNQQ